LKASGAEKLDEAESYFSKAARENPRNAEIANNLGYVYQRLGKFSEAESALTRSAQINPQRFEVWISLSTLYASVDLNDVSMMCLRLGYSVAADKRKYLDRIRKIATLNTAARYALNIRDFLTEVGTE
jgi:tetratricopeptide (TPR) repeat protein